MSPTNPTLKDRLDDLRHREEGTVLVFAATALAVFLGFVALSFDLGRVAATDSELQSFADSVALAAAGELDGNADAIIRATAAATLVADSHTFGNTDRTLSGAADYTLTFLSALPASDADATTAITTDPFEAVFVRVDVTSTQVDSAFGDAFSGLTNTTGISGIVDATATAGFTQYACDVAPLMFCVPNAAWEADSNIGDMIMLRAGGNGAAWGPGNFGFLDPAMFPADPAGPCAGLNGTRLDACLISAEGNLTQCVAIRGVDTLPGQRVGVADAIFNVRFDMYHSTMNGNRNDPVFAPAPNVIKGLVGGNGGGGGNGNGNGNGNGGNGGNGGGGNQCVAQNPTVSTDTMGLPRDDCFATSSCGHGNRFGSGNWTAGRANYVAVNYGGTDPHPTAVTRYEYYLAEIAAAGGPSSNSPILTGLSESGRPQCSSHQSDDPDRRTVIAAAIDCNANPIRGRETGVPVREFVKVFMTEPVSNDGGSPQVLEIHVEVVGSVGTDGAGTGGNGGIFRDVVQLYR